jgi:hypothetical protein
MVEHWKASSRDILSKKKPESTRVFRTLWGRLKYTDPFLFVSGCVQNTVLFFCVSKNCVRKNCVKLCKKTALEIGRFLILQYGTHCVIDRIDVFRITSNDWNVC